jgi:hypothetical protein
MEIEEAAGEMGEMEAPAVSPVAVAISGSRSSRHALKWALDKFVPEGRVFFRILHVRPAITMVPTPSEPSPLRLSPTDFYSIYDRSMQQHCCNSSSLQRNTVLVFSYAN